VSPLDHQALYAGMEEYQQARIEMVLPDHVGRQHESCNSLVRVSVIFCKPWALNGGVVTQQTQKNLLVGVALVLSVVIAEYYQRPVLVQHCARGCGPHKPVAPPRNCARGCSPWTIDWSNLTS
jgi:hypothetical protein